MQLSQHACHRQSQLSTRAQSRMAGNVAMHSQANTAGEPSVPEKPFGELGGTLRVRPLR